MSSAETLLRATTTGAVRRIWRYDPRRAFALLRVVFALLVLAAFSCSVVRWTPMAFAALPLVLLSAAWIGGGAATALIGLLHPQPKAPPIPPDWQPASSTAILLTLCREAPRPVARHLDGLRHTLDRAGLGTATRIFVLSDTSGSDAIAAEEAALAPLIARDAIRYRRREDNIGRKPGNIDDWLRGHGDGFDFMLVLDADSRMSAPRIRQMIRQLESRPRTGLLQAGIALVPGRSRFGRHQRIAARLLAPGFVRGFAAWTGKTGNYWGHNALIRIAAFRDAQVPALSGKPPFGGPILSHDFVEAAWIRRAGWAVEVEPALAGSAEQAPQTLDGFHRRDRRWCQGNLQHLRLLAEPGLHPISRFHLAEGVISYLAAPVWLALVAMVASGAVTVAGALPFAIILGLLLLPKICVLTALFRRARTAGRRGILLRAFWSEVAVSALLAPLVMVRQAGSVASVLAGRDCGWKSGRTRRAILPIGGAEALAGGAITGLALIAGTASAVWLAPLVLPLLGAPLLVRYLDAPAT